MRLRFMTAVSTSDRGYFHDGRVIEIDPTAPDFPWFQGLIRSGVCVVERTDEIETTLEPRAIEQAVVRRSRGRRRAGRMAQGRDAEGL